MTPAVVSPKCAGRRDTRSVVLRAAIRQSVERVAFDTVACRRDRPGCGMHNAAAMIDTAQHLVISSIASKKYPLTLNTMCGVRRHCSQDEDEHRRAIHRRREAQLAAILLWHSSVCRQETMIVHALEVRIARGLLQAAHDF